MPSFEQLQRRITVSEASAIATLARYFHDPRIGLVTGHTKYMVTGNGEVGRATNVYTSLERAIKTGESRWGCCVGADGAIFAVRRATARRVTAAGGISTRAEIDELDANGVDAVVGMAVYTGKLALDGGG